MKKPEVSVTIVTLNEEKNLTKCLESVKDWAGEIIVVDSGSTDKTVQIAKRFGAKVYVRDFDNFANQKNFASKKATFEWIFSIDADEVAPKELGKEVIDAIKKDEFDGYLIPRRNIILGAEIKHTRWNPDKHIWLWKKSKGKLHGGVHGEVGVQGKVGTLTTGKIHYQYETIDEFLQMVNSYTNPEAKERLDRGVGFSYFKLFFDPAYSFLGRFIYKKGFLDGWRGFALSYLRAIYKLAIWVKIWEKQR
ncbi:glycosyl transferase [Candidatus Woesebacteria bacterium]|nr:glycosyl transferase [Candidatus Woesebacteria bacterium]